MFTFVDTVPRVEKASPDTRTEINKGLQPEIKQAVPPSQIKNLQTQMVVNGLTEELDLTPVSSLISFLAGGDISHRVITFVNSLDPDQDQLYVDLMSTLSQHKVGPDLDLNCLTL